jgi:hypothetical protein
MQSVEEMFKATQIIIVEGRPAKKHGNISHKNLVAKLDHLMFRGVHVIYTKCPNDTSKRLATLIKNFPKDVADTLPDNQHSGGSLDALNTKMEHSSVDMAVACLCAIKNVSAITANEIIKLYSIKEFMSLDIDQISKISYPSGVRIGDRAKKIYKSINKMDTAIKVLAKIKGVSKDTATELLDNMTFDEICTSNTLADFKKSERRLGKVIAERIQMVLNYKFNDIN